jgi:hypothetical protein
MARLVRYFQAALGRKGAKCIGISDTHFEVKQDGQSAFRITTDREAAKEDEQTSLLGLEHPLVKQLLDEDRQLEATARALIASQSKNSKGLLTVWHVSLQDAVQRFVQQVIPIGLDDQGKRNKGIERILAALGNLDPASESLFTPATRKELGTVIVPDMLRRDLAHKGMLSETVTMNWRLLAWVELV